MLLMMMLAPSASCQREDFEPLQPPVVSINMSCSRVHSQQILVKSWSKSLSTCKGLPIQKPKKIQITKYKIQTTKYKKTRKRNWMFGTVLGAGEPPIQLPEVTEARVCLRTCCIPWTANIYISWTLNIKHCFNRRNFQPKMLTPLVRHNMIRDCQFIKMRS